MTEYNRKHSALYALYSALASRPRSQAPPSLSSLAHCAVLYFVLRKAARGPGRPRGWRCEICFRHALADCCAIRARGGHSRSHRLYSHSCDRSRSMVNGQSRPNSTGAVNGQSGSKVRSKTRAALFMATCRQVLQGQIADRSKVNGRKSAWSTVKTPKTAVKALTRGRSCDYSVYGSDPPL